MMRLIFSCIILLSRIMREIIDLTGIVIMKKATIILALILSLSLCLTGCGSEPSAPAAPAAPAAPVTEENAALTINGVQYSPAQCNLYFAEQYFGFLQNYAELIPYLGIDTTNGVEGLKEQECTYASDGTWFGYFLDAVNAQLPQVQALGDYAKENNIALSSEDQQNIDYQLENLNGFAISCGYDSAESYLSENYGEGITEAMYREYLEANFLADKAYSYFMNTLSYSDEELAAHYLEMDYEAGENDYPVTSMCHILFKAEESEDGTYSDEAIAQSRTRAMEIFDEWAKGERTEESFAALAAEYSEDPGVLSNDGYYDNISKGMMVENIDKWLFEEGRKTGDTAIIENVGSYVGTHIVYFTGHGDLYSNVLALEDLKNSDISAWFGQLMASYEAVPGPAYDQIGQLN